MISERLAAALAALLVPVGMLAGLLGNSQNALLFPLVIGLALGLLWWSRRGTGDVESAWTVGQADATVPAPARGSVSVPLGRIELRELFLSPWFHAGIGFCVIFLVGIDAFETSWWATTDVLPLLIHPLCGLTIVAVHRNATRASRDGAVELFESCPATTEERRRAHLLTAIGPVLVAGTWTVVLLGGTAVSQEHIYGPIDARVAASLLIAVVILPVGAAALGSLLARVGRSTLVPIAAVAAIALVNLAIVDRDGGVMWLSTANAIGGADPLFVSPPMAAKIAWLAGLAGVTAALAWSSTRALRLAVGGAALGVVGAVLAFQPLDAPTADRLAGYWLASDPYVACDDLAADVELCTPAPYRDHARRIASALEPVAAAIPPHPQTPITIRWITDPAELQREVRQRIADDGTPENLVAMPFSHHESSFFQARFRLAATAVGIHLGPGAPVNTLVDGQARGVVLIWLATRGLDRPTVAELLTPYSHESPSHAGHVWPGVCATEVQFAPEDVAAARLVADVDRDRVADVVHADWARWTEPETPTDELLAALGLPAQGPSTPISPLGSPC